MPRASPWRRAPATQKNELKPWQKKEWCIPKVSGEFVARMEDVLDLYQPEYNPERPVVCFDETSRQLTGEVRPPIEAAPGRVARYEHRVPAKRDPEPVHDLRAEGWLETCGGDRERRTAVDFAHQMRWLVDEAYPDAEVVRLVLDNLEHPQDRLALRSI